MREIDALFVSYFEDVDRWENPPIRPGENDPQKLYSMPRRMAPLVDLPAEGFWSNAADYQFHGDMEHGGWLQIFHAQADALLQRPWYPTVWEHAGGCDSGFALKWPRHRREWLTGDGVIHIGPAGENWCGRVTDRVDDGAREAGYVTEIRKMEMRDLKERRERLGKNAFALERLDKQARVR